MFGSPRQGQSVDKMAASVPTFRRTSAASGRKRLPLVLSRHCRGGRSFNPSPDSSGFFLTASVWPRGPEKGQGSKDSDSIASFIDYKKTTRVHTDDGRAGRGFFLPDCIREGNKPLRTILNPWTCCQAHTRAQKTSSFAIIGS